MKATFLKFAILVIAALPFDASSQTILEGKVTDKTTGEELPMALIEVFENSSKLIGKGSADFDGNYKIVFTDTLSHKVLIRTTFFGYEDYSIKGVILKPKGKTLVNFQLEPANQELAEAVVITQYERPMVEKGKTSQTVSKESIKNLPGRELGSITSVTSGVYVANEYNSSINARGGRASSNEVLIDGVMVSGSSNFEDDEEAYEYPGERYNQIEENREISVLDEPRCTFGVDVDQAAYTNARSLLLNGVQPHPDAVRVEECINYFKYKGANPKKDDLFGVVSEISQSPWNAEKKLLRITLQTAEISKDDIPQSNLVFLVDVSGSMSDPNKLELIQKALLMLVDKLDSKDRIALVTYAGSTRVALESTPVSEKDVIKNAIKSLNSGGSTNGAGGIQLAYEEAVKNYKKKANNRVILCTDGDFNVGISSQTDLIRLIEEKKKTGIFLSVIGVGRDNYQEGTMEQLADKGNGNFNYIHDLYDAKKVLVDERFQNLFIVAKDVKTQIEFNPTTVSKYRLIGYENRIVANEDFENDSVDGGEIGMGHQMTIVYEIELNQGLEKETIKDLKYSSLQGKGKFKDEIATISAHWVPIDGKKSQTRSYEIMVQEDYDSPSEDQIFISSVIAWAGLIRQNSHLINFSMEDAKKLATSGKGEDQLGYRSEFAHLVDLTKEPNTTASR